MKEKNMAEFYKGYWRNGHSEGEKRVGVVVMTILRTMINTGRQFP